MRGSLFSLGLTVFSACHHHALQDSSTDAGVDRGPPGSLAEAGIKGDDAGMGIDEALPFIDGAVVPPDPVQQRPDYDVPPRQESTDAVHRVTVGHIDAGSCSATDLWFFPDVGDDIYCGTIGEACEFECGTSSGCTVGIVGPLSSPMQIVHCPPKKG